MTKQIAVKNFFKIFLQLFVKGCLSINIKFYLIKIYIIYFFHIFFAKLFIKLFFKLTKKLHLKNKTPNLHVLKHNKFLNYCQNF